MAQVKEDKRNLDKRNFALELETKELKAERDRSLSDVSALEVELARLAIDHGEELSALRIAHRGDVMARDADIVRLENANLTLRDHGTFVTCIHCMTFVFNLCDVHAQGSTWRGPSSWKLKWSRSSK